MIRPLPALLLVAVLMCWMSACEEKNTDPAPTAAAPLTTPAQSPQTPAPAVDSAATGKPTLNDFSGNNLPQIQIDPSSGISYSVSATNDSTGKALGWGYQILVDSVPMINQKWMPGVSGNQAFKTKAEAVKVATLAVNRMKKWGSFPTISLHDLDSLGVYYIK